MIQLSAFSMQLLSNEHYTVSPKKLSTLAVFLSNINQKDFFTAGKSMKFVIKTFNIFHYTLSMLLHYPGRSKVQICCKIGGKCN